MSCNICDKEREEGSLFCEDHREYNNFYESGGNMHIFNERKGMVWLMEEMKKLKIRIDHLECKTNYGCKDD